MNYIEIAAQLFSAGFFIRGAQMENKSTMVAGLLSFSVWLIFTNWIMGGLLGGFISQVLLLVTIAGWRVYLESRRVPEN